MKTKNIIIASVLLWSLCSWQATAQGRIKRSLDPPTSQTRKSDNITTTGSKTGNTSGGNQGSGSSLGSSSQRTNGSGSGTTTSNGHGNQNSNVIHLNVTKRKSDGKTSAIYGTHVGVKDGRRHVYGNGPNKQGKGHIVKKPDGTTDYHRTMNGTVKIDKKD